MFDDPKKELQLLEEQLLKEEDWFEKELNEAKALIGDAPRKSPAKKAPKTAPNAESRPKKAAAQEKPVSQQKNVRNTEAKKPKKKKKGIRGLVILAILETLGIVGVVAYWLLFLL